MNFIEVNFDGLVGPTHNYAGLSSGNLASISNRGRRSNPKLAALQGLEKMKRLHDLGMVQGVFPPQERPCFSTFRRLGYTGTDQEIIAKASIESPKLFKSCFSSSAMWAANSATISPAQDTQDGKIHITAANLSSQFHRSLETNAASRFLQRIFKCEKTFTHHAALPTVAYLGDEGAANHLRFCQDYGNQAVEAFVYGRGGHDNNEMGRQTLAASKAIARLHQLNPEKTVFIRQNPEVIKEGAFHNDVISVNNKNVMMFHEKAFLQTDKVLSEIAYKYGQELPLYFIRAMESEVSLADAVKTYLFNSQIISLTPSTMAIIAPIECQHNDSVLRFLQGVLEQDNPIKQLQFVDLQQSMANGGGPACLRFRMVMNESQLAGVNRQNLFSESLHQTLVGWVERHFRDRIEPQDLQDPLLLDESRSALDELSQILHLGSIYDFQLTGE